MIVSWVLNKLTCHSINEERDEKHFLGRNKFYSDETCLYSFQRMRVLKTVR
jgi:hypothetical protein